MKPVSIGLIILALVLIGICPLMAGREEAAKETAVAAKSIAVDTNDNEKPDRWEYYDRGQLVRIEADTNEDGKIDEWAAVKEGKIVSAEKDSDYDGKKDRWITY